MGFGYLLIGYLITFVLYLIPEGLGLGGLALLAGYGMMLWGLWELSRYNAAFSYAKWTLFPLLLTAVYDLFASLNELFLWELHFFSAAAPAVDWIVFLLVILYNFLMLYGIRTLTDALELSGMSVSALRNAVFVLLYAVLYLIGNLPIGLTPTAKGYLVLPLLVLNLAWIILNLALLLACNKNICREGEEEQPEKPSRFGFINKLNEAYEKNRQKTEENAKNDVEDYLRRRNEKRAKKDKSSKKKRKK